MESYDHIELTEQEKSEALRQMRGIKHFRLIEEEKEARRQEVRRQLTEQWSADKTLFFMKLRNEKVFGNKLVLERIEGDNFGQIFDLLCLYFSNDHAFELEASGLGIKNPDLRKGIMLVGSVGTGKSSLMRLFGVNQRQVYGSLNAREVADEWASFDKGEDRMALVDRLSAVRILPANDIDNFYQRHAGLCLDDCGTENIANGFGNRKNVIADIIQGRYDSKAVGPLFHMTSNLTAGQLIEFYGPRVGSRLRETMNVIHLTGPDRRK